MEHINSVHVSIKSVDVAIIGHSALPNIVLKGSLKNVSKGNVILTIATLDHPQFGNIGQLVVEDNRPVMQGTMAIEIARFDVLLGLLSGPSPRPASVMLALHEHMKISSDGYLIPDNNSTYAIADASWNIPVQ